MVFLASAPQKLTHAVASQKLQWVPSGLTKSHWEPTEVAEPHLLKPKTAIEVESQHLLKPRLLITEAESQHLQTRSLAVRAHHQALYAEAERLVRQAFPYLVEAPASWIDGDGEVPVTWTNGDAEVHSAQLAERTDRIDRDQS